MKLFVLLFITSFAFSKIYADSPAVNKIDQQEHLKKFQAEMRDLEIGMVFFSDMPLADVVSAAPELIILKAFKEAKEDASKSDQAVFTIKAIGHRLKDNSDSFSALKNLGTREAAIKYAQSISTMSDLLAGHLSGEDPSVPDVEKLISSVTQRRAELVNAFPLLASKKR